MLVQCPCGKILGVKGELIGKKVRCPACKNIFVAEARPRTDSDDRRPLREKRTRAADADEDDNEPAPPSGEKPASRSPAKGRVSWLRTVVSAVLLGVLLVAAVFLVLKRFSTAGSLRLEVSMASVDIFIDGKKIDSGVPTKLAGLGLVVDLEPGTHEIKITKDRYHPFIKEISISSGKTETLSVDLKRIIRSVPQLDLATLKQLEGTWVVTYSNQVPRVYTVTAKGEITWQQTGSKHALLVEEEDMLLEIPPALERWRLASGKLQIQHFDPPERYPSGPFETAVGVKKTPEVLAEDARILGAFAGRWTITYTNKTHSYLTVDSQGRVEPDGRGADVRRLVRIKGDVLLHQSSARVDRLTLDGKQLNVEAYFPSRKYPEDPANPQLRGTGVHSP
jgi:hypothetical protein